MKGTHADADAAPARKRLISVFSGAGGLDLGLELAGFDPVLCLDTEPRAQETLRLNRETWRIAEDGDVLTAAQRYQPRTLALKKREIDLIAGGPPCQPFSKAAQWSANSRQGLLDPRGSAVFGMLDLVEKYLPRAMLIENVTGFLVGKESALSVVTSRLNEINRTQRTRYHLQWWIVDAADYGVPQKRKRAIAVAFRDGSSFSLPPFTHDEQPMTAWDALHDYQEVDPPAASGSWTPLLASIAEGHNYQYLSARGPGPEIFGWRTRYWSFLLKLSRDRPSWTLPASPGPNTGPFHWDNRPLSVRERLRLQSFPDDWQLAGTLREQYALAGNATPPLLAEVMGMAIARHLDESQIQEPLTPSLLRQRAISAPKPRRPRSLPDKFRPLVGPQAAHPGEGQGPSPRPARQDDSAA